jgi:hypothetical protein
MKMKIILTGLYDVTQWSSGIYDKRHLFGYAGEDNEFTPGTKRLIASVKDGKLIYLFVMILDFRLGKATNTRRWTRI